MSSQCLSSLNVLSTIFLLGVDSHDGSLQLGQFDRLTVIQYDLITVTAVDVYFRGTRAKFYSVVQSQLPNHCI
ncbi:unnamed protein product [Brugia pahangi]|uniref:Secreted protein n=1 Tax=Brugia pahangi TaxID=6280 RepID=A0A0N4SXZ1_BRUPA|nr:unnamed protein product [Brugia pahangi]